MIITGLCSIGFREKDVDEVITLTRTAGLDAIEWGGDVHVPPGRISLAEKVRKKTISGGLKILSYGSYYRAGLGDTETSNPPFGDVLTTAEALGAETVRIWAGSCNRSKADRWLIDDTLDDIRRCADMAEARGMSLSFEYHEDTFTGTDEEALMLAGDVNRRNVKFYWQPIIGNGDVRNGAAVRTLRDRISHVHAFHWPSQPHGSVEEVQRMVDSERERWKSYLTPLASMDREICVFLELCEKNENLNFPRDAALLREVAASFREEKEGRSL